MATGATVDALKPDESRFTGEGADLTLLHWLRHAEQAIEALEKEALLPCVQPLQAFFLKVLLPSPNPTLPKPGRPIRHLISRCMVKLHKKVESRSLFDFVQALVRAVADGGGKNMSPAENVARVASWYCIGEVMKEHGTNMMSFTGEICTSSVKVLRNSNLSVILRTHAILAFSKSLVSAGRALPDALVKDLLKGLRAGLSDKALSIQRACAETFVALQVYTSACPLQATIDSLAPLIFKSLETADYLTRRALSRSLAHFLAATQVPGSGVPLVDTSRKATSGKNEGDAEGSEPTVITSAPEERGTKTLLTAQQMLKTLSMSYNRPQSPRKLRNAIIDVYATLFTALGNTYVESHYAEIVKHVVDEIVVPARGQSTRYEVLTTREDVGLLMRDLIGVRLLSESGQVMAIREWTNVYLKKWSPAPLPGQVGINKHVLVVALREVAGLLEQLGNAPPSILELLAEPLIRLLSHPSYTVRLSASYTLRRFCTINPSQLPRMLDILLAEVTKDLSVLGTPAAAKDVPTRIVGKAFALSALIAISHSRPLYVSQDISTKALDLATSLLKKAGEHEIGPATVEIQVAWYLIAALLSLGPSFVKLHLPQLLVLWRNALPKPTSKDTSVGERGEAEWSFLLLVRECALAAVLNFLRHNATLVNIDVARRLATMFTNTLNFVNGFATAYAEALREQANDQTSPRTTVFTARPSLVEREANLRRRVLQCFTALGPSSATESMQPALLQAAITVFADPENYSGSAAQAAIAAQSGQFTSIWQSTDGYAFGVTSLLSAREGEGGVEAEEPFLNRDRIEMSIESQLSHPILGSLEHDFLELFPSRPLPTAPKPPPPQTGVVDAGVDLFATIFPYQNVEGQVQSLATLSSHVRSSKLERNPGRRQAVVANTMAALRRSLAKADAVGQKARKALGSAQVTDLIKSLLQDAILDPVPSIRQAAAEAMGMLSSLAGSVYLSSQVQWLVDQVVNNRVPDSRAGCALAFGSIYHSVGGMGGGPILKTIVNILMSLATDPHPVVHFWAMSALTQVINAANLSYSPFVPTTLGMIANIYLLETHEPDGGSLGSVNIRGDLPAYQVICRLLHAIIGVLGPELQEPGKIRSLVFLLVHEFGEETDEGLAVEAIKCVQQFLMFAPAEVDIPKLVLTFRSHLASTRRPLKVAAITALYQIVQRDAILISKLGGNQLVEDLFGLLDDDPSLVGVRNVITSWLQQTAAALPSGWIDLCQRIMTRTSSSAKNKTKPPRPAQNAGPAFIDDEGESLGGETTANNSTGLTSRWRTQLFALDCLHSIIQVVGDSGKGEHFNPDLARRLNISPRQMLFSRVADLIRMAFSASAAVVMEVRLAGLVVLRDVVMRFSASPDPDFEGALLLEQHQAPIAAALTPSFGADSAPEVLASAIQVCAVFVGSGVIKEVSRMGRILRLLTTALEQCKDGEMLSLGDNSDLSPNASVMLKVFILAAWAELQVASLKQDYLNAVIKPYKWILGPFWLGSLRDYAGLRTDPEMGAAVGLAGVDSGIGRDVLLPYYEQAVPKLLEAVSISLSTSDSYTLAALDGTSFTASNTAIPTPLPASRADPVALFYIMYGLSFEVLVKSLGDSSSTSLAQTSLRIMQSLVRPQLAGMTVFEGAFFDELCTVAYRIAMSESAVVKKEMVELMAAYAVSRQGPNSDAAQARRVLAVITFALRATISSSEVPSNFAYSDTAADRVVFLRSAFAAFSSVVNTIEITQRADLYAVGTHLFGDVLKDETPMDLAGGILGSLKGLLDGLWAGQVPGVDNAERVIGGLLGACMMNVDDMRTRVNPVASVKIKNNLLAITLVMTSLPPSIKVSKTVIEQIGYTIGQYFDTATERPELGLTAVHCASTLLSASLRPLPSNLNAAPSPSAILQHLSLHLLPPLITYLSQIVVLSATSTANPPLSAVQNEELREVIKALVTYGTAPAHKDKAKTIGILLPTLCLLLDPSSSSGPGQNKNALHTLATSTLLALAQREPAAFKDATNAMAVGERSGMETAIREAIGGAASAGGTGAGNAKEEKKGIELRSFS